METEYQTLAEAQPDPVPDLISLLGQPVVFIGWPLGLKGTRRLWGHLKPADMTPDYLAKLKNGNIGVANGEASGGLCVVDIDDDALVQPFLDLNPGLADTFSTRGARGRVFWVRLKGLHPKTFKLRTAPKVEVGEFRSNGSQSIAWGVHPDTQNPYQWIVRKPVIEIEFKSIQWPEAVKSATKSLWCTEEPEESRGIIRRSISSGPSASSSSSLSSIHSRFTGSINSQEDLLRRCVLTHPHTSDRCLFELARGVLNLEQSHGKPFSPDQLREVFQNWHSKSKRFLRADQSKEAYWMKFLSDRTGAKYPLGGVALQQAWKQALENAPPPEAMQFENQELRLIVALCRELQRLNKNEAFYLSSYVCQKLLGHEHHSTAAKWLRGLRALGIIKLVECGNAHRASRYRYAAAAKDGTGPGG